MSNSGYEIKTDSDGSIVELFQNIIEALAADGCSLKRVNDHTVEVMVSNKTLAITISTLNNVPLIIYIPKELDNLPIPADALEPILLTCNEAVRRTSKQNSK